MTYDIAALKIGDVLIIPAVKFRSFDDREWWSSGLDIDSRYVTFFIIKVTKRSNFGYVYCLTDKGDAIFYEKHNDITYVVLRHT